MHAKRGVTWQGIAQIIPNRKDNRLPRHKAQIPPRTALYEILELENDGAEQSFLVESDIQTSVCPVQFIGMTVMANNDYDDRRRQYLHKLANIFAGLAVGPGRALTDTAAQVPTMGDNAERI